MMPLYFLLPFKKINLEIVGLKTRSHYLLKVCQGLETECCTPLTT